MAVLWGDESSVPLYQPRVRGCFSNLGSVVQSLRCNSSGILLVVRPGCKLCVSICQDQKHFRFFPEEDEGGQAEPDPEEDEGGQAEPDDGEQADVMKQLVDFEVRVEQGKDCIEFDQIWDLGNLASISVLEAMQTNTIVRSLELDLDYISGCEGSHLTCIVAALLKNDTLQSFSVWADYAIHCSFEAVRAAFEQILKRNMCLRKIHIAPFDNVSLQRARFLRDEEGGPPCWQVDLGDTVSEAIKRNCQAFAVAEALGRVSKSTMLCYPHFGDIEFRRQLLLFFLVEGCQPPRMMLSVAKGLRK